MLTGDLTTAAALVKEEQSLSTMTRVAPVGYTSLLLDAFHGDAARAIPVIKSTIETATKTVKEESSPSQITWPPFCTTGWDGTRTRSTAPGESLEWDVARLPHPRRR